MARPPKAPRQRLLDAAVREFATHGFAGARIEVIARRAKMNKQLVYHYFGSKQGIYDAVFEHTVAGNLRQLATPGQDRKLAEAFDAELRHSRTTQEQAFLRMLMFEALGDHKAVHMEAERRAVYDKLTQRVRQAQERGEIDPSVDPALLNLALLAVQLMPSVLPTVTRLATDQDPRSSDFLERWSALLTDMISRFAPPEPPAR